MSIEVYILAGVSGAGKTHWANLYFDATCIVSADDYFTTPDGTYEFVPAKLPEAHNQCLVKFTNLLMELTARSTSSGLKGFIVVDNTNTSQLEMAPYIRLSQAFGAKVELVLFVCSSETALTRTQHQVPAATIRNQAKRLYELFTVCSTVLRDQWRNKFCKTPMWNDVTITAKDEFGKPMSWDQALICASRASWGS